MKLNNPISVCFREVLENYLRVHKNSDKYVLNLLEQANKSFKSWIKTQIPIGEIGKLIIPYHIDRKSRFTVIQKQGERLNKAYKRLLVNRRKDYENNANICFKGVMHQKRLIIKGEIKSFLFSQGPFVEFGRSYQDISSLGNDIVHLDGLHRLLAIMDLPLKDRPLTIESYIAIRGSSF